MTSQPDTSWTDDEIVMTEMTPDTTFVFDRMTDETIAAVDPGAGEFILDVACGRAIDALALAKKGAGVVGIEASGTMIDKAFEFIADSGEKVIMARALAEALPFCDNAFDKVVCKGALDHFVDIEKTMAEMTRVTKPDGRVIIAIANFESLTCRMGRLIWTTRERITGTGPGDHPFWEPPEDHNHKFDLDVLKDLMAPHCHIEKITGTSLLWGFPKWGAILQKMPDALPSPILAALDVIARIAPSFADVLVAVGKPRKKV